MDESSNAGPVDEQTLVDIIKRAQHDADPDAFEALYLLFANRVFRYLLVRLADRELAEEVTAQVFVRLIEKITLYQLAPEGNVANFTAWLYQVAYHKMVDVLRAHRAHTRIYQAVWEQTQQGSIHGALDALEERWALEGVLQQLQHLSEPQRAVLVLRFLEDLSIAETAKFLQKSETAVKALQRRALESLRRYLAL